MDERMTNAPLENQSWSTRESRVRVTVQEKRISAPTSAPCVHVPLPFDRATFPTFSLPSPLHHNRIKPFWPRNETTFFPAPDTRKH